MKKGPYVLPVLWMKSSNQIKSFVCLNKNKTKQEANNTVVLSDYIMYSHNGAKGPETKTMRTFRSVRQVAAPGQSLPSPAASCFYFQI